RFPGYFGDTDFGLRAQAAGFRLVCATGAWLHHVGAGFYQDMDKRGAKDTNEQRMREVEEAYQVFRDKWGHELPPKYPGNLADIIQTLRAKTGLTFPPQEPLVLPPDQLEIY